MDRLVASPELSLAIAAKGLCDATPFWAALRAGGFEERAGVEMILAHDGPAPFADAPPEVIQLLLPNDMSVFELWGAALTRANSPYVAIMDIHAPPCTDWLDEMLRKVREGGAGYFGAVEASYAPGDRRLIGYLVEYVQFHRPIAETMREIPGNNLVVRRDLLADSLDDGFSKTALMQDWAFEGRPPPVLVEDAVVGHCKPFNLWRYCIRRYRHGRCYAAQRVEMPQHPPRLWLGFMTPLLPLLRVWRIARHTIRVPTLRWPLLRFLIPILLAETAWSYGELLGYLAGEGDCRALLD